MSKLKILLAVVIWVVLGFIVGVAFVGLGFALGFMLETSSVLGIIGVTVLGMLVVLAQIIQEIINEKE